MVSEKRPKYQQKQILDLSFLFTVQNIASGYTCCHLENCFFLLYAGFKKSDREECSIFDKLEYTKKHHSEY